MNKTRLYLIVFLIIAIAGSVVAVIKLSSHSSAQSSIVDCKKTYSKHLVYIKNSQLSTNHINGKLCDTMTIINEDNVIRLVAFGPHEHHTPYDGITEEVLGKSQELSVTYNQAGTFSFHDHLHDWIRGTFTVEK